MRSLKYTLALLFLFIAIPASGPLGCELLKMPEVPTLEAPEVPSAEAPKGPEGTDPDEEGACCIRRAESAAKQCPQGQDRCCNFKLDRAACEDANGVWYKSGQDCGVMC